MEDIQRLVFNKTDEWKEIRDKLPKHSRKYRDYIEKEEELLEAYRDYLYNRGRILEIIYEEGLSE